MPRFAVELTVKHIRGVANPLDQGAAWYLLDRADLAQSRGRISPTLLADELQEAAARAHRQGRRR